MQGPEKQSLTYHIYMNTEILKQTAKGEILRGFYMQLFPEK